jgi:hypothetical protein
VSFQFKSFYVWEDKLWLFDLDCFYLIDIGKEAFLRVVGSDDDSGPVVFSVKEKCDITYLW